MTCEWDPLKAAINRRKHGVEFGEAAVALEDALALTVPDDFPDEQRFTTIGRDARDRLLVIVWSPVGDRVRLISARHATRRECRQYMEGTDA